MAGNCNGNQVGGAGLRHRAHRFRGADPFCDFGITCRRAGGDIAQRLPHPLLESGAPDMERQIETDRRRFDEGDDASDPLFKRRITTDQFRLGKAILKIAQQQVGVVPEQNGTDPLVGGRD